MEEKDLNNRLAEINSIITPYKIWLIDPNEAVLLEKNARFMSKQQEDTLARNVKNDGFLSQLPFAVRRTDGSFEIISGNHRVVAARKAGLAKILVLFGDEADFPKERKLAMQLAHNALAGEDDAMILKELYSELETVLGKEYTGIDEKELFGYKEEPLVALSTEDFAVTPLTFVFCDTEFATAQKTLQRLERIKLEEGKTYLVLGNVDDFIATLTSMQTCLEIKSRSVAFARMCEICQDWIEQNEQKTGPKENENDETNIADAAGKKKKQVSKKRSS